MSEPLLLVEHLKKDFDGVTVVDDISFSIEEGESVGLVGESGCGKSTTARLVSGLLKQESGSITIHGKPVGKRRRRDGGCLVNMVFQDPEDSFDPHMTVYGSLYEALRHTKKCSRKEAEQRIDDVLCMVGLDVEYKKRKVSALSGGQCQRVGIARTVLTEPELFICDEATSALDVSVQAQIIQLFMELKEKRRFSYLFISHDLALVSCLCSRIMVMYRGRIVESGEVWAVMEEPRHPYTELLVRCAQAFTVESMEKTKGLPKVPQADRIMKEGCSFYPYCSRRQERCRLEKPELTAMGDGCRVACHFPVR